MQVALARRLWHGTDPRWRLWGLNMELDGVFGDPTSEQRAQAVEGVHPWIRVVQV